MDVAKGFLGVTVAPKRFRPEIEGLRAVAALLVAVFHIWLRRVSGGVDVFFVVSGFLISTVLLGQVDATGAVRFKEFWSRLIMRLAPAAMLVLTTVMLMAILWMPHSRWKDSIENIAASAVYVENWLLAFHSVDYLAQHESISPVQHYWALSVQGQFYLVWPLLFAAAVYMARRRCVSYRSVLQTLLCVVFTGSFVASVDLTAHDQPLAYFNTLARAWEFCLGALLAMNADRLRFPKAGSFLLGWLGLIAIVTCGFVLQVSRVFPGYAALWPTLAAAAIIVAGNHGGRFGVHRVLAAKPLVYLGGLSYGIYLWHFPILVFSRMYSAPKAPDPAANLLVLVGALLLAAATDRLFERPTKGAAPAPLIAPWPQARFAFTRRCGGALCASLALGLVAWSGLYLHARHATAAAVRTQPRNYPGALALAAGFRYQGEDSVEITPSPLAAAEDREYLTGPGCDQPPSATMPNLCLVAGTGRGFVLAVVGGSHSSQWLPALRDIADRNAWTVVSMTKSNCPFYLGESVGEKAVASCHQWNENALRRLQELKPAAVFTTSTRFADDDEFVPDGYVRAWQALSARDIRVIALRDNPDFEFDAAACVEIHGAGSEHCMIERHRLLETPSPVELLTNAPRTVRFIDLSDYFCTRTHCSSVIGNVLVYRHHNHITATYARTLAPMLERELWRALEPAHRQTARLAR